MKTQKLKASAAGPIPASGLVPVLSLRDVDGKDLHRGLYRNAAGQYLLARCRDGIPNTPIGETISPRTAFRVYSELLGRIRPGVDVHRDGEVELIRDMQKEVQDPEGAGEKLTPLILVGWGNASGYGIFLDRGSGAFFTGKKLENGGVDRPDPVPMHEALQIASEICEWTEDTEIEGLPELLRTASERVKSLEKRVEIADLVAR